MLQRHPSDINPSQPLPESCQRNRPKLAARGAARVLAEGWLTLLMLVQPKTAANTLQLPAMGSYRHQWIAQLGSQDPGLRAAHKAIIGVLVGIIQGQHL